MTVGFNPSQGPTVSSSEVDTSKSKEHHSNFLFAFLAAENKNQNTMNYQQIADANSTSNDANIESAVYNGENSILTTIAGQMQKDADASNSNQLTVDNANYQEASSAAQGVETVQNNTTQTQQQASGQDATNLQNLTQLTSALTSVLSTIASLVGHAYT